MKTLALRSLQTAFLVSAMTFLTGANGQGCGKVVLEDPPQATPAPPFEPAPGPACAAGWHLDQLCSVEEGAQRPSVGCADPAQGSEPGYRPQCLGQDDVPAPPPAECHDECVPDSPCGAGFVQQEVCSVAAYGAPDCPPGSDCGAPPEPTPSCELICVPAECPVGSHAEWMCSGGGAVGSPEQVDGSQGASKPVRCMPGPDPVPMPDGPCSMTCVPDSQLCPPGSQEQTTCSTCASPNGETDCVAECFTECVPFGAPEPTPAEAGAPR